MRAPPPVDRVGVVDRILEGYESQSSTRLRDSLAALAGEPELGSLSLSLAQAIDAVESGEAHRILVAVLLRGVALDSPELRERDVLVRLWRILDSALGDDGWRTLRIDRGAQGYVVEAALRQSVLGFDSRVQATCSDFADLNNLNDYRGRLMKDLRSLLGRHYLEPFLPQALLGHRMDLLFRSVETYRDATRAEGLVAFNRAIEVLEAWRSQAAAYGTRASTGVLAKIAEVMKAAIEEDFAASTLSKPAELVLETREKRYPLHEPGREFEVSAVIRNAGEGPPDDVALVVTDTTPNLKASTGYLFVGRVDSRDWPVRIPLTVVSAESDGLVEGRLEWSNVDGKRATSNFTFACDGQRTDLDFDQLENEEPYSLEPVTSEDELVGRADQLRQLHAMAKKKQLGSAVLFGQKRVGKTSLARTLVSRIHDERGEGLSAIYVEAGDIIDPDPRTTVDNLGRRLCVEVRNLSVATAHLEIPPFQGALTPLVEFLSQARVADPDLRVAFVLDEFDELPVGLYKRGDLADAFFLTLRSISAKSEFGFILVGGEKMEYILSSQGDALNKFQPLRVDYFDRHAHWGDYGDLIRRPVAPWLDAGDSAVERLFAETAGNPYYTKQICAELFRLMVRRRDSHVTEDEVAEAVQLARVAVASNSFQHFWEDGIVESGPIVEDVSVRRRKVLLSMARLIQTGRGADLSEESVLAEAERYGVAKEDALAEVRSLVRRHVLAASARDDLEFKVPFFRDWLVDRGASELLTSFLDWPEVQRIRDEQARLFVRSHEIVDLIGSWGLYRGTRPTEERVRAWLEQFEEPGERRLMFKMLTGIQYYGAARIRERLSDAHEMVRRGLSYLFEPGRRKRAEILVSYLGGPGKSGASYAKLYADENEIYYENVVESLRIGESVADGRIQAVVLIDDFIGSGGSFAEGVAGLSAEAEALNALPGGVYLIAIAGFLKGKERVEKAIRDSGLKVTLRIADPIDESGRCFGPQSAVFPDSDERERAAAVATTYGRRLVKAAPLGFAGGQALVVFESTIPNNCPAVLWEKSGSWMPLFPRH